MNENAVLKEQLAELQTLQAELRNKVDYIQEQSRIIEQLKEEINLFKSGQGKRSSKREETLQARNERYEQDFRAIIEFGHNKDCLFCGYKDKMARKALESEGSDAG